MVIVDPPSCCYFKLNIPHGIVSIEQKWGKHMGTMAPGYHCCYCSHKRIGAMITKNSIMFNTPVRLSKFSYRLKHALPEITLEYLSTLLLHSTLEEKSQEQKIARISFIT
jgi:hypothetical protein